MTESPNYSPRYTADVSDIPASCTQADITLHGYFSCSTSTKHESTMDIGNISTIYPNKEAALCGEMF